MSSPHDGEADAGDAAGVDVRPTLQKLDRRQDVLVAAPAEEVAVAVALALAAPVEEQDAVAVAGEEACRLLRTIATGKGDHCCAVSRRDVPAG